MRHCVEFFERFLDGIPASRIDYASRRRDPTIESSRTVAFGVSPSTLRRWAQVGRPSQTE